MFALAVAISMVSCKRAAPASYAYRDLHTNAILDPSPQSLGHMKVGLLYAKYHFTRAMGRMDEEARNIESESIKDIKGRFASDLAAGIRDEAIFALIDTELKSVPVLHPKRIGVKKRHKYRMLKIRASEAPKVAAFIEANQLDAALTVDGSIEYLVFKKSHLMLLRLDWILYDRNGTELYSLTTYNSAPAKSPAFTPKTVESILKLMREGTKDFGLSIRDIKKKE